MQRMMIKNQDSIGWNEIKAEHEQNGVLKDTGKMVWYERP